MHAPSVKPLRKNRARIQTVSATSVDLEVAMPSGYPHSRAVRWRLFDQVCLGVPLWRAAQDMGVSTTVASIWWRNAGAMKLVMGRGGGVPILETCRCPAVRDID